MKKGLSMGLLSVLAAASLANAGNELPGNNIIPRSNSARSYSSTLNGKQKAARKAKNKAAKIARKRNK